MVRFFMQAVDTITAENFPDGLFSLPGKALVGAPRLVKLKLFFLSA